MYTQEKRGNMNIKFPAANLYQKAIKEGAQLNENNEAVRILYSKGKYIAEQTINRYGDYKTEIYNKNADFAKTIKKTGYDTGSIIHTWNNLELKGKVINQFKLGQDVFRKIQYEKITEDVLAPKGRTTDYCRGEKTPIFDGELGPNTSGRLE